MAKEAQLSQAPAWDDPTPGAGCANDDRAGQPCDCGRDDRGNAILTHIATGYGLDEIPADPTPPR